MRPGQWIARITGIFIAAFLFAPPARADESYPLRSVRMVMPFPPGSSTDLLARLVADELSRKWGQAVVVDNVVGGMAKVGASTVYRAAPDGYTLLFSPPPPLVINHVMIKEWGIDPARWETISVLASVPYALDARPDFPGDNVQAMIAAARAKPGEVTYMSGGIGATAQLSMLQIEMMTGVKMLHVPYRGAAPALVDLMGSHIDVGFDTLTTSLPVWKDGKIKILGVGGRERSAVAPEIPTIAEQGLPGFQSIIWFGMVAPPGTPSAIVSKISADVAEILHRPALAQRMRDMGLDVVASNPGESRKFFDSELALWGKIVTDAGIVIE